MVATAMLVAHETLGVLTGVRGSMVDESDSLVTSIWLSESGLGEAAAAEAPKSVDREDSPSAMKAAADIRGADGRGRWEDQMIRRKN